MRDIANTDIITDAAAESMGCNHYYQPKYDPTVLPSMEFSRCTKCGIERWTNYDQIEEWKTNGLNGKQVMTAREEEVSDGD